MKINIEDKSRLRKLKKSEAETSVSGSEYAHRMQEYYEKTTAPVAELFSWAKPKVEAIQKDTEDDPIAALLRSNVKVFESHKQS